MAKNETIQIRVKSEIKESAVEIFSQLGINISDAINIFLHQTINENGFPFELKLSKPNAITIKAIEELEAGKGIRADSIDSIFDSLDVE